MAPIKIDASFIAPLNPESNHRYPLDPEKKLDPLDAIAISSQREWDNADMKGVGIALYAMTYPASDPTDGHFTGQTIFRGTLKGKNGGFALKANGTAAGGIFSAVWAIIEETAHGELKGISGKGSFKFDTANPNLNANGIPIADAELEVEFA